jgi:hypothetical protein
MSIIDIKSLESESDVEQKFVGLLLTNEEPLGLGYSWADIRTKKNIKELKIDKGNSSKIYFPDYVIIYNGLPVLVIEVKRPGEDLDEAYREARLYANEINSAFPSKINPCRKVIVSNGLTTKCGPYDSERAEEIVMFNSDELTSTDVTFYNFRNYCSRKKVFEESEAILSQVRGKANFIKPTQLLGGRGAQEEELKENSFGNAISLEFRSIFNPETKKERSNIAKEAYVATKKLNKHVLPIERIIRNTTPIVNRQLKTIQDTSDPKEIISKIESNKEHLRNQLLLLIGNVGAGKSTFTDFLKEKAVDNDLSESTEWITINLNQAPINKDVIYTWINEQIVKRMKENHKDIDFDDPDISLKIYSVEYNQAVRWASKIFANDNYEQQKYIFQEILKLDNSIDVKAKTYARYFCGEKDKLLIVVLDNCDRRTAEDQLLMFDVANWLKETFKCLVFLPMRDTTYDIYKKQKPLDTVIKDLVFRIEPPLLRTVITERVKYALRVAASNNNVHKYEISNSIKVEYQESDLEIYLNAIVRSLFQSNYFNSLISGIAGRDIRRGLEIFLDFCKSGHIQEGEIFKMKQFGHDYILQAGLISRVIIHGSRKYYNDGSATVKNVFFSNPEEDRLPNPFTRLFILDWLSKRSSLVGPSGVKGFYSVGEIMNDLIATGHEKERILKEINYFISIDAIITESQKNKLDNEYDLISVTSFGHVHLDLIKNINYLSACSEDVFYRDNNIASSVYKRISGQVGQGHFSRSTSIHNSKIMVEYLRDYSKKYLFTQAADFLNLGDSIDLYNLNDQLALTEKDSRNEELVISDKIKPGTIVSVEITSIQNYGAFVQFNAGESGLVFIKSFERRNKRLENYDLGDRVQAEIVQYNVQHKRYNLNYVEDTLM